MNQLMAFPDALKDIVPFPFDVSAIGMQVSFKPSLLKNFLASRNIFSNRYPNP
jgi:hypothetical protein